MTVIIDGIECQTYPDNDGGMWCYHPITGQVVRFR